MTIPRSLAAYAVAGAALCAVLTACEPESDREPSPEPGPAVTQSQDAAPGLSETDLFLAAARAVAPTLAAVPDTDLTDLGQSVCAAFDRGASTGEVAAAMIGPDALTGTEAGAVVGSATGDGGLCPEHGDTARAR
ncbi:hypothetical protein SEA_MARKY_42 [Streptomyces phage Marky]|nr:hypothetical protein SEA_MARKY_42 [Streptomyces phage Marky]